MHHKRSKPSRRRRRAQLENKSYRQAAKRSLHGARAAQPRSSRYSVPSSLLAATMPVGDLPSNGKPRSKAVRPAKKRCPQNRTHEWYVEEVTIVDTYKLPSWVMWNGEKISRREVTECMTYRTSTCIHCWEVRWRLVSSERQSRDLPERAPSKQRRKPRRAVFSQQNEEVTSE